MDAFHAADEDVIARAHHDGIGSGSHKHEVIAVASNQSVVAIACSEECALLVSGLCGLLAGECGGEVYLVVGVNLVVAVASMEGVVKRVIGGDRGPSSTDDDVIAVSGGNQVCVDAATDGAVTFPRKNDVGSVPRIDVVVAIAAED